MSKYPSKQTSIFELPKLLCFIAFFFIQINSITARTTNDDIVNYIVSNDFAFTPEYCDKEEVVVPDYIIKNGKKYSVDEIPRDAFKGCKKLKKVTLPSTITDILEYAFSGCENLEEVIFPEYCQCIDISFYAFEDCKSLKTITLPYKMQQICENAFIGCENLRDVYINACIAPQLQSSSFVAYPATLYVPKGCISYYYNAPIMYPYGQFFTEIKESDYRIPRTVLATLPKNDDCYTSISIAYGNAEAVIGGYSQGPFCIPKDEKLELRCRPKSGLRVTKLMVNDVNYADSLKYHCCKLWVGDEDINIEVETEPSTYLTICQSESGAVRFEVQKGEYYKFNVLPSEGWVLHSVTFNGYLLNTSMEGGNITVSTPKIMDNSIVNIAFEKDNITSSSVINAPSSKVMVYVKEDKLIVENAEKGEIINVYNESGMMLRQVVANGYKTEISLPSQNLYIVKTKCKTIKIRMS